VGTTEGVGRSHGAEGAVSDALIDQARDGLIALSCDGTVLAWNQGASAIFGYARNEAVGRSLESLIVLPPEHGEWRRVLARTVEGEPQLFEATRRTRAGAAVVVDISMRAVKDRDGSLHFVVVGSKDVTPIKRLRDERATEAKFQGLLEAAPDAMVIVGEDGKIVLVNGQTEKVFGYSRQELLGQPVELLAPERFRGSHPQRRTGYSVDPRTRPMGAGLDLYVAVGSTFSAVIPTLPQRRRAGDGGRLD
jgi:PAS domain S-box-containing protein